MSITMPALIIRAPYAVAQTHGVSIVDTVIYKHVECRGRTLATEYRGAVAIFASRNRAKEDSLIFERLFRKHGGSTADARAYCMETFERYRYRLVGFIDLFGQVTAAQIARATESDRRRLHAQALDLAGDWQVETYLCVEPLHAPVEPGPEFTEACVGCLADPPHNKTACHAGWQTVRLPDVPAEVQAKIGHWPLRMRSASRN